MAELTITSVVFALEQLEIVVDSVLLRRIEWALGGGNYDFSEQWIREEIGKFALSKQNVGFPKSTDLSLEDFLSEKGISLKNYRRVVKSLKSSPIQSTFLSLVNFDDYDIDSSILKYAQNYSKPEVLLECLRGLELGHSQCKAILGIGAKSYDRLKKRIQDQRKENVSRTGRSEQDAWSFAKHVMNSLCLRYFKALSNYPLLILETHQGIGDASYIYRNYGSVLGFDNHEESHKILTERAKFGGFYQKARDLYMQKPAFDINTDKNWIFLTEEATTCEKGLKYIKNQNIKFDVIDIDPFGSSRNHFINILDIINESCLIMITVGDQHPWPKGDIHAWEYFGVDQYDDMLTDDIKKEWRREFMFLRRASAWYMQQAISHSVCLLPIFILRNFEPWIYSEDFSNRVMGVDRIYFLAKRVYKQDQLEQIFFDWTEPLPILDEPMLKASVPSFGGSLVDLSFLSFTDDIWPAMRPYWFKYHEWLVETAKDIPSRWHLTTRPEVVDARNHLWRVLEEACSKTVYEGFNLADNWLRNARGD